MEEKSRKRKPELSEIDLTTDHPPRIHVHYEDPEHVHKRRRNERKIRQETAWLYHESPVPSPPDGDMLEKSGAAVARREDTSVDQGAVEDTTETHTVDTIEHVANPKPLDESLVANPKPLDESLVANPKPLDESLSESIRNTAPDEEEANVGSDSGESSCESTPEELSDFSSMSEGEESWRPVAGPISWVQRQMALGQDPHTILSQLLPDGTSIPDQVPDFYLWKVIVNLLSEPPQRKKLDHINTFDDVINLIRNCKNIMVLTGAGVSVSCGIPDFRSRDGIYSRLAVDYPDLPDPQAMFDIHYFKNNQKPFFQFAREIFPGQFQPSISHKFIQLIESHGRLLRNYTQNIDTLEQVVGIKNVVQCHGSFATATCMVCQYKVDCEQIKTDIFNQVVPRCPKCPSDAQLAIMKPDIVFFGESLPESFHRQMAEDKDHCDLLIVIGSSLKVRPVALIPSSVDASIPQILINREPLDHLKFDIELLGDCDVIISEICNRLGNEWDHISRRERLEECQLDALSLPPQIKDLPGESEPVQPGETTAALSNEPTDPSHETPVATSSGQQESDEDDTKDRQTQTWLGSLSDYLKDNSYVHLPPCRYVFEGAEVFSTREDASDNGSSSIAYDNTDLIPVDSDLALEDREATTTQDSSESCQDLAGPSATISSTFQETSTCSGTQENAQTTEDNECSSSGQGNGQGTRHFDDQGTRHVDDVCDGATSSTTAE